MKPATACSGEISPNIVRSRRLLHVRSFRLIAFPEPFSDFFVGPVADAAGVEHRGKGAEDRDKPRHEGRSDDVDGGAFDGQAVSRQGRGDDVHRKHGDNESSKERRGKQFDHASISAVWADFARDLG